MHDFIGHFLSTSTYLDDRDDLGGRITYHPDPHILVGAFHVGPQFVQLDMDQLQFVHELKGRLRPSCVPVFSTDGLRHYFYALTAHFGSWEKAEGKRSVWVLVSDFLYAQVIKHHRRRKTVEVERRILIGDGENYHKRLKVAGLSGRINTSFVERLNLSIRQCVSKLPRLTWGPAHFTPELLVVFSLNPCVW